MERFGPELPLCLLSAYSPHNGVMEKWSIRVLEYWSNGVYYTTLYCRSVLSVTQMSAIYVSAMQYSAVEGSAVQCNRGECSTVQ